MSARMQKPKPRPAKVYVLYGGPDTDTAPILCTADSIEEARADKRTMFPDAVIYEYDSVNGALRNGRLIP